MKFRLLCLLTLVSLLVHAQTTLPDDVVASIQKRIEIGQNPSIAVGIVDSSGMHYFNYGFTHTGGKAVNEHSIYEIGSISKVFTGILLADMSLRGLVSPDDPAQKYLPESAKLPTRGGQQITLGQLSDHTSALPRMPDNFTPADPMNPYADYSVQQLYDFLSGCELTRDIGSEYEYSNLAQGLLGHILALVADTDYETLMQLNIAIPLGMHETAVELSGKMKKNLARPHSRGVEVSNWDIPSLAGAGGIRSSVYDMLRFVAANLGQIESPLYPAMELSHQKRHDKRGAGVGLGWHLLDGAEGEIVFHNGQTGGYIAFAGFVRETGRGVVILTNSDGDIADLGFHLLNPSAPLREIKPHIAQLLRETIDADGIQGLDRKFEKWKTEKSDIYDFSEMEINALGYYYLSQNQTEAAVAVFKINTTEHPASSNVWDSYGEGLMLQGDTAAAIANYEKSLELNPGNTNAVDMLANMGVTYSPKDLTLSADLLETYVGAYELMPGFIITITRDGTQLTGQATGQPSFEMFAKSATEFYLKVVDAQIVFHKNESGIVDSLTLYQGGQEIVGKKK